MIERPNKENTIYLDTKGVDDLLKAMSDLPSIKVGVLGPKDRRNVTTDSNATIGLEHEYGLNGKPMRSFLRMPLIKALGPALEKSHAFTRDVLQKVLRDKSIVEWCKKIAIEAEGVIADAFDTGGFGEWPKWKNPNYTNNTGMILVDTQQLRNSITSEVK